PGGFGDRRRTVIGEQWRNLRRARLSQASDQLFVTGIPGARRCLKPGDALTDWMAARVLQFPMDGQRSLGGARALCLETAIQQITRETGGPVAGRDVALAQCACDRSAELLRRGRWATLY